MSVDETETISLRIKCTRVDSSMESAIELVFIVRIETRRRRKVRSQEDVPTSGAVIEDVVKIRPGG